MQKPPGIACHDGLSISFLGTWSRAVCLVRNRSPTYSPPTASPRYPLPNAADCGAVATFQAVTLYQSAESIATTKAIYQQPRAQPANAGAAAAARLPSAHDNP